MEHDQRFKALVRTFFADFLRLFFAEWAARFDLSEVEWLDRELAGGAPQSPLHIADMVARVSAREPAPEMHAAEAPPWLVLVHVEIESADRTTRIKPRLPEYYYHLRAAYGLPVLPIVIYLNMHLQGIGEDTYIERFWEFEVSIFRYLYVGLLGLDGVEYVQGDNWLGVALAALMRIPPDRVAWLGAEALRRLGGAPLSGQERFLLAECVQAYLPLDEAQQQEYERLLQNEPFTEVKAMNLTVFEKGQLKTRREDLLLILEERFGAGSEELRAHVESLPFDALTALMRRVAKANTLAEAGLGQFAPGAPA